MFRDGGAEKPLARAERSGRARRSANCGPAHL